MGSDHFSLALANISIQGKAQFEVDLHYNHPLRQFTWLIHILATQGKAQNSWRGCLFRILSDLDAQPQILTDVISGSTDFIIQGELTIHYAHRNCACVYPDSGIIPR